MPPKKKSLYIGMDIANFNTVVVFKWEGDSLVSFVGSQEDDASQHPFPSTVYALYTPNGEGNSSMQNTNISGAKHEEGTSIHIEGFKPLFHLQRSHEVSDPIRAYLNISCSTTVENAPLRQRGILMRVRRGNMSTLVDPVLCMKAFLQFLQQRTVDKTGVDLSQDVEIFITASCPIDVPLAATDELKRLITEVWQSGPKQQAKVSVQVTREPFSGALYVQDWVFCGKGSKLGKSRASFRSLCFTLALSCPL